VSQGKQAKTLTKGQVEATIGWLASTRYPTRNGAILLLSVRAGLRAKEIASLTWTMVTDADRQMSRTIHLLDKASKGRSGRAIPMHRDLRSALQDLYREAKPKPDDFVITTERSKRTSPQVIVNLFARWYEVPGFNGCSSHSGRRTFISSAARKISTVDGSLRNVRILAGHANLRTTQRYIEPNASAQARVGQLN
jgi:integrase/recombinase XerD